ncbi:hypothetical protein [Syntrophus aciditrophicus]|uniref:Hypothetical membrane protein n=1 Tax=Syntrophus aciditrophicus (strain SB) TaxID=56780 RepID=Q2LUW3_SYNAS|nr:hypothetical protein [Syntrophus aciditrophicus]ABC77869.1 hypothetical membrane protein [Syntrophus aciditrophicus SB]
MTDAGKQDKLKIVGIYLIVILALLRFLVYPLYSAVEKEKRVFDAQRESYLLKVRLLNQQQNRKTAPEMVKKEELAPYLYEKSQDFMEIQLGIVHRLNGVAREKGGELVRFEILETIPGKTLSEAPVTLWFSGPPKTLMDILQTVETSKKILGIRNMEMNRGPRDYVLSLTLSAYRLEQ